MMTYDFLLFLFILFYFFYKRVLFSRMKKQNTDDA